MPAWKKSMGLVLSEPSYLKGMMQKDASYVLIDLRPAKEAKKGHIAGAVSIPAGRLAASKSMFPEDKSAPIILYNGNGIDKDAFMTVRGFGYKNVSALNGGAGGWEESGGKLASGRLASSIVYVKRIPRGEIGIDEFKSIAMKMPADKVILDVRDAPTASQGMIKGAVNIPLDDLEARMSDLPSDKEIVIHCNTGIMAGMARKKLEKNGYKARSLNAIVQIDPGGSYEVTEK